MNQKIISFFVIVLMMFTAQPIQAQKWLKAIGKGLSAAEKVLGSQNNNSKESYSNSSNSNKNTSSCNVLHETANTKVYNIDGNVNRLEPFSNGLACVRRTKGQWFVINNKGDKVFDIPVGYRPKGVENADYLDADMLGMEEGVGYNSNRLMVFSYDEKKAIIYDNTGKAIKTFSNVFNATSFVDGVAIVCMDEQIPGKWGKQTVYRHVDVNGNTLSTTMDVNPGKKGISIYPIYNGLTPVLHKEKYGDKPKGGFRNAKCQWVIKPTFAMVTSFRGDGLARVQDAQTGKWGYINTQGNWVIQPTYTNAPGNFHCGLARVTDKSENVYFIDKTGRIVFADKGKNCGPFMDKTGYAVWNESGKYSLVNTSFKKCFNLPSNIESYDDKHFVVHEDKYYVAYDWNGNALLKWPVCNYGYFYTNNTLSEDIGANFPYNTIEFTPRSNDVFGYFNLKGEIIVEFKDTQF